MKRILFSLLAVCLYSMVDAQQYTETPFKLPKELPHSYYEHYDKHYRDAFDSLYYNSEIFLNPDSAGEDYFNRKIISLKHTVYGLATSPKRRLEFNSIYYNWKQAETYISDILQLLMNQSSFKGSRDSIRVHIMKDAQWNAFAQDANQVYVTTGLLAGVENEAALAWILGHELGHVYNRDVTTQKLERVIERKEKDESLIGILAGKRATKKLAYNAAERSRLAESRADEYGSKIIASSGYDMSSAKRNMEQMHATDSIFGLRKKRSKESLRLATHPLSAERSKKLDHLIDSLPEGKEFLVSKNVFESLQKQSRYENLISLKEKGSFYWLCQYSFQYHLQFPDDPNFIYWLLEGLRVHMALSTEPLHKTPFLMEVYKNLPKGTEESITSLFPLLEIPNEWVNSHPMFENGKLKYNTYQEVWDYASALAIEKDLPEAYLTLGLALIDSGNGGESREYFEKYMALPIAKNKQAVSIILGEDIPSEEVSYVSWDNVHSYYDVEMWDLYNNRARNGQLLSQMFHHNMRGFAKEDHIHYLYDLHLRNFNDYVALNQFFTNASQLSYRHWRERPRYLLFFRANKSNEFYSPLWFWPEYTPLLNEYKIYDMQLVKERFTTVNTDQVMKNNHQLTVGYFIAHSKEVDEAHKVRCKVSSKKKSYTNMKRMLTTRNTYRFNLTRSR